MNHSIKTILAVLFLLTVVVIFFFPVWKNGKLPVPSDALVGLYHPWRDYYSDKYPRGMPFRNFLTTDPVRQQIPWRKTVVDSWKSLHIPAFDPYTFGGVSLGGNSQSGAYYPFNVLFFWLPFPIAWTVLICLEPMLMVLFMYMFLRTRVVRSAAVLGSICFAFSGFSVAWMTWGTITHVAVWIPAILFLIDKIVDSCVKNRKLIKHSLLLILCFVCQVTAGHIQISFYALIFEVIYIIMGIKVVQKNGIPLKRVLKVFIIIFITVIIVCIPFIIQCFRLITSTVRIVSPEAWRQAGYFLPYQHLVQYFVPDFFGNPATLNYWGVWNYGEFIGYIGVIPIIFAIFSIIGNKNKDVIFFGLSILVALFFMLPSKLSFVPYILKIPGISSLQPTRLTVIVVFSLSILASYGMDYWIRKRDRRLTVLSLGITGFYGILFTAILIIRKIMGNQDVLLNSQITIRNMIIPTILALFWSVISVFEIHKLSRSVFRGIIVFLLVIITADLVRFGWKFVPFTESKIFYPETAAIVFLKKQNTPFRIATTDKRIFPPNVSEYYGIETIEGYDSITYPRYISYMNASEQGSSSLDQSFGYTRIVTVNRFDSRLLDLANVKYILSLANIDNPSFRLVFSEGETKVYENLKSMPRFYFTPYVISVLNEEQAMATLLLADFNPESEAVCEQCKALNGLPINSNDKLLLLSTSKSGTYTLKASVAENRFMVIANAYSPYWTATIDGVKTTLYRTNYYFQGIMVPEGNHSIVLTYNDFSL